MKFSENEIQEIITKLAWWRKWKDTDFWKADLPLSGEEYCIIVQEGENRKLYLKDLLELIDVDPQTECTLTVTSDPDDATILINGEEASTYTGIYGDTVTVAVYKDGYIPQYYTITLTEDTELNVTLVHYDTGSTLEITSSVIYLGQAQGSTEENTVTSNTDWITK